MMKSIVKAAVLGVVVALLTAGWAGAADVNVSANIAASTTWVPENVYNLTTQIYVLPGATLTIEAGTVVASTPTPPNGAGSLAVCRGAKIIIKGTPGNPVIMTSRWDVYGGDPAYPAYTGWAAGDHPGTGKNLKSGMWRVAANEWGNLTVMGKAYIGCYYQSGALVPGNTAWPNPANEMPMEGLTAPPGHPEYIKYGGGDDDDDSGEIHHLSLRYGGRVVGLTNELNGLSLGAIGRETEIDHVEIMNNVDDGIEIWGGTVNLKYISIWNVGDDSFDIDQGWRGMAQFILIVQGYSLEASQGSGVGDNCFEVDGAEDSDAQPVTTGCIYNATAIGQPHDGDVGTAWRANAHVQYRNCIFMDLGDALIKEEGSGDGHDTGWGAGGSLTFAQIWTKPYTYMHGTDGGPGPNPFVIPPATITQAQAYQAQSAGSFAHQGFLAEITDSVFYNNLAGSAYTTSDAVGVTVGGDDAPLKHNIVAAAMPIQGITRVNPPENISGKMMARVLSLNPCAANDALTSEDTAPLNGFFTPVQFRGAFSKDTNWLKCWTAADAYGMTDVTMNKDNPEPAYHMTTTTTWTSEAGLVYTVEVSDDMFNWEPLTTVTGTGGEMSFTDLDQYDKAKFYRAIRQ